MAQTPKEKAKELIVKFKRFEHPLEEGNAKRCALIAVEEMIAVLKKLRKPEYTTFIEWDQLKTKKEADTMDGYEYLHFLETVKEEIQKL